MRRASEADSWNTCGCCNRATAVGEQTLSEEEDTERAGSRWEATGLVGFRDRLRSECHRGLEDQVLRSELVLRPPHVDAPPQPFVRLPPPSSSASILYESP